METRLLLLLLAALTGCMSTPEDYIAERAARCEVLGYPAGPSDQAIREHAACVRELMARDEASSSQAYDRFRVPFERSEIRRRGDRGYREPPGI